jgi:hypothetical protein
MRMCKRKKKKKGQEQQEKLPTIKHRRSKIPWSYCSPRLFVFASAPSFANLCSTTCIPMPLLRLREIRGASGLVRLRVRRVLCKVEMGRGMNLAAGGREGKVLLGCYPSFFFYFFSTLTFWLSQERPSKIPGTIRQYRCFCMQEMGLDRQSHLLRWWRNWARPSIRGPWLFCRGPGLGLRRLVALL